MQFFLIQMIDYATIVVFVATKMTERNNSCILVHLIHSYYFTKEDSYFIFNATFVPIPMLDDAANMNHC